MVEHNPHFAHCMSANPVGILLPSDGKKVASHRFVFFRSAPSLPDAVKVETRKPYSITDLTKCPCVEDKDENTNDESTK